jgi:hypothetical protein
MVRLHLSQVFAQKGFAPIFIVILLVLVTISTAGGLITYQRFQDNSNKTKNQIKTPTDKNSIASLSAKPVSVASNEPTLNWKIYTNANYQFSLEYPSNWTILDCSKGTLAKIYFSEKPLGRCNSTIPVIVTESDAAYITITVDLKQNSEKLISNIKYIYKDMGSVNSKAIQINQLPATEITVDLKPEVAQQISSSKSLSVSLPLTSIIVPYQSGIVLIEKVIKPNINNTYIQAGYDQMVSTLKLTDTETAIARDAKRIEDIKAISIAFEANYDLKNGQGYPINNVPNPAWFASGVVPKDPKTGISYTISNISSDSYMVCAELETRIGNANSTQGIDLEAVNDGSYYCRENF